METVEWSDIWTLRSQLYAFLGNSVLHVITEETADGLAPAFWREFPLEPANEQMEHALARLDAYAQSSAGMPLDEAVRKTAVEYTHLFIGPKYPKAPLWESLYRKGAQCLYGQPTFDVREVLREHKLALSDDLHQLEDHLGVELLYLSAMSQRFAADSPTAEQVSEQLAFISEHLLWWIPQLLDLAQEHATAGYYAPLIELIWGILQWDRGLLQEYAS